MFRRLLWTAAALLGTLVLAVLGFVWGVLEGGLGSDQGAGQITAARIPREDIESREQRQRRDARALAETARGAVDPDQQILFGDLHVHTTFSNDAFLFSLPIIQGEGAHPPADACDFARFCSGLDFWSINDHAELLTPRQWRETRESIRQCDAAAGDPDNPDLVSFLGWEWTQMGTTPETHYGHKNVILRDLDEGRIPTRPISAGRTGLDDLIRAMPLGLRGLMVAVDPGQPGAYADFNRYRREATGVEFCPENVDVRSLPEDCLEAAPSPRELFDKLSEWGFPSLVIPHGTSWGIHAPPGASLRQQLDQHDPERERLFEVYSGHGTSEIHRAFRHLAKDAEGVATCPAPADGFEACCWRAGELIRARCSDPDNDACEDRATRARQLFVEAGVDPRRFGVVPGATLEEWEECGQLTGAALPAYTYRPGMSAQYGLAISEQATGAAPADGAARAPPADGDAARFRFGLIGSSDNHKARGGSGYKEFARKAMGDAWGLRADVIERVRAAERGVEPVAPEAVPPATLMLPERGASFYYTGGLVAAHAAGRDREAIWSALERRQVYGTSGERILLWFDLLNGPDGALPMGSEVVLGDSPRFRVRAIGALEQRPGCPDGVRERLGPERLARLCLDECYYPGEHRHSMVRIEVVRIRAQHQPGQAIDALIDDPWRVIECPPDPGGCVAEFEDPSFPAQEREVIYYVRALQEETPAVNGDPLRCERDASGRCLASHPCNASGADFDPSDDCLAPVHERAWSSPIFVRPDSRRTP